MAPRAQLAVVTGASTGIGQATAHVLAARGLHVLAGVRRQADADRTAAEGIEPVMLDITDTDHIAALGRRVRDGSGARPLRALVNNAGIAINAPVEVLPLDEWRRQFEVNLFGHIAVTQALLPALLDARGRVVNVSSIGGRVAAPLFGAYAASKFALEAVSDALRREVARLGVRVVVVEPGTVATPIWDKGVATAEHLVARMSPEQRRRYGDLVAAGLTQAASGADGIDPAGVGRVIARAIAARRPRARYLVGRDARVTGRLVRVLPDRAIDRLIARSLRLGEPSADAAPGSTPGGLAAR